MPEKSLDVKLRRLRENLDCGAFILADAKDADMSGGVGAVGRHARRTAFDPGLPRSLAEYRENMRAIVQQGLVDILLMSAHSSSLLTLRERLFDHSPVTPAIRANDTTDIWRVRGGVYADLPSYPFRTALLDHAQAGRLDPAPDQRRHGVDLGLYSVTFNNDLEQDVRTLEAYRAFRVEAEQKQFRHFLEVFDPNTAGRGLPPQEVGAFVNDMIVRMLAGVPDSARPLFLKMVYHGPRFTEELVAYDPTLIVGVLGGPAGTTLDAFRLVAEAKKYGARAALFGRKINAAEHPLTFVFLLRRVADGDLTPEEAVRAYHGELEKLKIRPARPLARDLQATEAWQPRG